MEPNRLPPKKLPLSHEEASINDQGKKPQTPLQEKTQNARQQVDLSTPADKDTNKLFYKGQVLSNNSDSIFLIPFKFLPPSLKEVVLKDSTENDYLVGELSPEERLKGFRKVYPEKKVYEVLSCNPLKLYGVKKITPIYVEFKGNPIEKFFANAQKEKNLQVSENKNALNAPLKVHTPPAKNYMFMTGSQCIAAENNPQIIFEIENVNKAFESFKKALEKVINQTGGYLFPDEHMYLIGDSLSQSLVRNIPDQDIERSLRTLFIKFWEKVDIQLYLIILHGLSKQYSLADQAIKDLVNLLKNDISIPLLEDSEWNSLIEKINKNIKPLRLAYLNFLENLQTVAFNETKDVLYPKLQSFLNSTLAEWTHCHITLDFSRKTILNWFFQHLDILETYMQLSPVCLTSLDLIKNLRSALQNHEWIVVFEYFQKLENMPLNQISSDQGTITKKDIRVGRRFKMTQTFVKHFKTVISNGQLFEIVAENAYKIFSDHFSKILLNIKGCSFSFESLSPWAQQLTSKGISTLSDLLETFKNCADRLNAIRHTIHDVNIKKGILKLQDIIEKERYGELYDQYFIVFQSLVQARDQWTGTLKSLNDTISKLQNISIILLIDAESDAPSLSDLQNTFRSINHQLEELVHTPAVFFHAFEHLLNIDTVKMQKHTHSKKMNTAFHKKGIYTLNLLSVNESYFNKLRILLEDSQEKHHQTPILEIDDVEEVPSIQSKVEKKSSKPSLQNERKNPAKTAEDIKGELSQIFQNHTKTRKIIKDIKQFLNDYHIYYETKYGKGDHLKLYVNGIPIPMPEHEEWKPGTLSSIENKLLIQVQEALNKK